MSDQVWVCIDPSLRQCLTDVCSTTQENTEHRGKVTPGCCKDAQSPTCQTGKQQQHAPGWLTSLKDSSVLNTLGAEQQLLRGVGYLLLDIT